MSERLKEFLGTLALGAGAGGTVGALAGATASVLRMDYGKGLPWLAFETVLQVSQIGLATGALCALVGLGLTRAEVPGTRLGSARAWVWIATGLLALAVAFWIQNSLWALPQGWIGRLAFFLLPVVALLSALALVRAGRRIAGEGALREPRWRWAVIAGAAVLAGFLILVGISGARDSAVRDRPNIVLVVIDCLRADRLGVHGYGPSSSPELGRLAARSVVFERAYSTAAWTKPAIVSVLTGLYPARHGSVDPFDVLPRRDATLPELLRNAGYRTLFLNAGNVFINHEFGFDSVFDDYEWVEPGTAPRVVDAFSVRLPELEGKPFFAYLHLMDVHLPYAPNPVSEADPVLRSSGPLRMELRPGGIKAGTVRSLTEMGELSDADREHVSRLYDAQVRFVDSQVKRLLGALDRSNLADRTMVIVTADHGEELWEHGNFEHGHSLYDEVSRVPLLIAGPPAAGMPSDLRSEPVSLVDLAPTILARAGVAPPARFQGLDLLSRSRRETVNRPGIFLSGNLYGGEKFAYVSGSGKAIVNTDLGDEKFPLIGARSLAGREWYAVGDRFETDNRSGDAPDSVWEAVADYRAGEAARVEQADPSAAARRRLETLGYLQ